MEARIFNSHIDIISPGELLRPLTIEKLQEHDYKPNSRNKAITKVLLRKGIMDERGSGILRMEEAMEKWELEKPNYAEKDGYFVITFKGPSRVEKPLDEEILRDLNERQKKALDYIKDKGRITNKEYREINKIGRRHTIKELNKLIDEGIITKKGKGRSIHYVLVRD